MSSTRLRSRLGVGFRNGLERDVYHVIKKLEAANDLPFTSISAAYEAIKRSNSSISRQKKQPLENAIDRVFQIRKNEQHADADDSDASIDQSAPIEVERDKFSLNRQMTKLWNTDTKNAGFNDRPSAKKRRIQVGGDDPDGGLSAAENYTAGTAPNTSPKQSQSQAKKQQKLARHTIERPERIQPLGGVDKVYRELLHHAWLLLRGSSIYRSNCLPTKPRILIAGPSGLGQKTLVKKLAAALAVPLISLDGCFRDPERAEKSLYEAFDTAISLVPCIVFVEHIEQHMPRPGSSTYSESHAWIASHFVGQMTRLRHHAGENPVLVMATTSKMNEMNPSLLEYGQFDEVIHIKVPDCAARRNIFKVLTSRMRLADDVDLDEIAALTHGYVGSDLAAITANAARSLAGRIGKAYDPGEAILDLHVRLSTLHESELDLVDPAKLHSFKKTIDQSMISEHLVMDDFKLAIKNYTPSLRKEGFDVIPDVTWNQVGALETVRKQLRTSIIGPIKSPELYQNFGMTRPAGVLLWGPPGCGKTLIAQAVANEAQASFIMINGPELLNKYVGESERAVRELFQRARSSTPCILFFDEIDSIVPCRRNSSTESGARIVNALLAELDGARDRSSIYVIGTTNRPEMIDEAMLRPGRLSVQLFVDLPTPTERVDILRTIYRTRIEDASDEAIERLAAVALDARCTNFSGADLGGLHIKAAEHALEKWEAAGGRGHRIIAEADWEHALANTHASVTDPSSYKVRAKNM